MNRYLEERAITCPYCDEAIDLLLDGSAGSQTYIEDCAVCCRPIEIRMTVMPNDKIEVAVDCA